MIVQLFAFPLRILALANLEPFRLGVRQIRRALVQGDDATRFFGGRLSCPPRRYFPNAIFEGIEDKRLTTAPYRVLQPQIRKEFQHEFHKKAQRYCCRLRRGLRLQLARNFLKIKQPLCCRQSLRFAKISPKDCKKNYGPCATSALPSRYRRR